MPRNPITFRARIREHRTAYFDIAVYPTLKAMRDEAVRTGSSRKQARHGLACTAAYRLTPRSSGTIFFSRTALNVGAIAHESLHAALIFCGLHPRKTAAYSEDEYEEQLASVVGWIAMEIVYQANVAGLEVSASGQY